MNEQEERAQVLKRFYAYKGEYYILVADNGSFVYEHPEENPSEHPEMVLRLFFDVHEASNFLKVGTTNYNAQVRKINLIPFWSLLPGLQEAALHQVHAPLRIEVTEFRGGKHRVVDVLHSVYEPQA